MEFVQKTTTRSMKTWYRIPKSRRSHPIMGRRGMGTRIEVLPVGDSELIGQGRHVPEKKRPSPEVVE